MTHPEAVEAVAKAIAASAEPTAYPVHFAWYQAGETGVIGETKALARVAVDALIAAGWAPRAEVAEVAEPLTREWLGVWPRQSGETAISGHINALTARIAALESQRDAVLAACDRVERDEPSAVFSQGGPVWAIWTEEIRAAYEEDEDA